MAVRGSENRDMPHDDYHAPDWLRSIRALYFDGYTAPLYPHMKDFDAKRLVEILVELGGDTLRFQPIGYRWANNLKPYNAEEPKRFVRYYESMSSGSAVRVAQATRLLQ